MNTKNNESYLSNFMRGFIGIFVYMMLNLFIGPILTIIGINVSELTRKEAVFISMIVSFIVIIVLLLLSWKVLKKDWKEYKKNWKKLLSKHVKYWVLALVLMFVANLIIAIIFNRLSSANDETIRKIFDVMPLYIILEAVILAPITEELVFRQSVRYIIKNKWVFIITSALLFGFMHTLASLETLADFLYIIPYSIPGGFFAYMLYEEDNVLVPMSFHMIHNTLAMILLIISKITGIV